MTPNRSWFETFEPGQGGSVLLGNNKACSIRGIGNIRLRLHDGSENLLKQVRFIPELKHNLISLGILESDGSWFKSENGVLKIFKNKDLIMTGNKKSSLYSLVGSTVIGVSSVATYDDTRLWHLRLAHVSQKGLLELSKQNLLCGDKIGKLDFCEQCVLGKAKIVSFTTGIHCTKSPFDYVHYDLWRPARTATHGQGRYFLSIIDNFSRRVWVHILKTKGDAFQTFKDWNVATEVKMGTKIKHLRTDNGLEFLSEQFKEFCRKTGITRHRTVRSTPQQNGNAERMNRTLLERVRCMLIQAGLPKIFWGEAVMTAAYLINRCPTSAAGFKTPMELWSGKPTQYENLKIFGCIAYIHVKQDKLEARAKKCIFIGYSEGIKGYKFWSLDNTGPKYRVSRDATFDESKMANLVSYNSVTKEKEVLKFEVQQSTLEDKGEIDQSSPDPNIQQEPLTSSEHQPQ